MYRRVVVPLDGSHDAEAILPFILEIAGPFDMRIVLLRVLEVLPPGAIEGTRHFVRDDLEARRGEAERYLAPIAARLAARGVDVRTEVRRGDPAAEIVDAARDADADLIAMATHGRSGLARVLFGSVAEAVLRTADVPVFVIRHGAARDAAQGLEVAR